MPKVIHKIKSFFHLALHRGLVKSPDPYSYNDGFHTKTSGAPQRTLDCTSFRPRCSRTFIKNQKTLRFVGFTSSFVFLALTVLTISPIVINPDTAEGTMGVPKASSSTLTIASGTTANLEVSSVSSTGAFNAASDADMATFTVSTTNYTGYTLNIAGSDNSGLLVNSDANASISSLTAATDAGTFAGGSAENYSNRWGYQANILNTSTSTYTPLLSGNYQPAPTTTNTAINVTNCANSTTSCPDAVDTYGIRLGARVDYSKPTGIYTNTFILTAIANDIAYAISYADNTNDSSVTGSPIDPAVVTADSITGATVYSAILPTSVPTRTGYRFRAWCLGTATHTADASSTCSGTEYPAGATFGIDQTIDNTDITLYALWNPDASYPVMQDYTNSICAANASTTGAIVKDARDDNTYIVRYINGNCWMVQNLRYVGDTGSTSGSMTMKATTSNINADKNLSYTDLTTTPYNDFTSAKIHNSENTTHGVWYNYAAASAGTITGDSNTTDATYDVCPKGWRLPTTAEQSGITSYMSNFFSGSNGPNGGWYYNGGVDSVSINQGRWWSNTAQNSAARRDLYYNGISSLATGYDNRYIGMYVRCIRDNSISGIGTMQSLGTLTGADRTNALNSMTTNTEYTLTDARDSQTYTVKKLSDGNVWMTRNLAIGCNGTGNTYGSSVSSKPLSSSDSNVSSAWSTPTALLSTAANSSATSGYTTAAIQCDSTYGAWYNYAAATAGTIVGDSNTAVDTYDICPKGWRLPTKNEFDGILSETSNFSLVTGGIYLNGGRGNSSTHGVWWSSTIGNSTGAWLMQWNSSSATTGQYYRYYGLYTRCILGSTMQGMSESAVSNIPEGSAITLRDSRDDQTYTTAKINGQLWMTRNLAIGCNGSGSTYGSGFSAKNLTPETSNVSNTSYTTSTTSLTSGNSYTTAYQTCNSTYGAWYNYTAASAGTISGDSNTNDAIYDICPKGWRLPIKSEESGLTGKNSVFSPTVGGYYTGGSISGTGYGYYWFATANGAVARYNEQWDSSSSQLSITNSSRNGGRYVRCVYDPFYSYATTMQQFGKLTSAEKSTVLGLMETGRGYALKDERDNQYYTIAKLADGKVWMMTNLNLGAVALAQDLTSSNTNLSTPISASDWNSYKKTSGSNSYSDAEYISLTGTDSYNSLPYGTLYNYCAASAGTICTSASSPSAIYDICPAGWRLPTGGASGEFQTLYSQSAYNSNANMRKSYTSGGAAFTLAGNFNNSTPTDQGSAGTYWSSTAATVLGMYDLYIGGSTVQTGHLDTRSTGFAIRCLLK